MPLKQLTDNNGGDQFYDWVVIATDFADDSVDCGTIHRLNSPAQRVAQQAIRDCSNKELMPLSPLLACVLGSPAKGVFHLFLLVDGTHLGR